MQTFWEYLDFMMARIIYYYLLGTQFLINLKDQNVKKSMLEENIEYLLTVSYFAWLFVTAKVKFRYIERVLVT